jgi:hypothetical protein
MYVSGLINVLPGPVPGFLTQLPPQLSPFS